MQQIQREQDDFQKRLADFPHLFQLECQHLICRKTYQRLKNDLEAARKSGAGFKETEKVRSLNLLAYTLFRLGEKTEALALLDEVLNMEDQHDNIVSLASKASMLWHTPIRRKEANQIVQKLEELRNTDGFHYLQVKAKAEMAADYMRFGHRFTEKAIDLYNKVIPEGREPEVWDWKMGLAKAYRHTMDLQHTPYVAGREAQVFQWL
ncbi:hypothetical protein BaRGS_00034072 [Batillaria attramentaria]|uniref:Uncharacterized protein n=1 Tax=Batillaria attramentaria TaxID=370345 RepID=A0ABD0JJR5_9CAEN